MIIPHSLSKQSLPLIIFDEECILCNRFLQWLVAQKSHSTFYFASRNHLIAKKILGVLYPQSDAIVYVDEQHIFSADDAVIAIGQQLPAYANWVRFSKWIPSFMRRAVYQFIARNRYKIFGKSTKCVTAQSLRPHHFLSSSSSS